MIRFSDKSSISNGKQSNMSNGIEIFYSIFTVNPKPFLTGLFETSIVSFGFGSERINFLKRDTVTVNGKSVIIGNGNVFCAAFVFLAIVPVFMITGTTAGF